MVVLLLVRDPFTFPPRLRPTYGVQVTTTDGLGQVLVLWTVPRYRVRLVFTVTRVIHIQLQAAVTTFRLPPCTCPLEVVNPVTVLSGAVPEDRLLAPEQILALRIKTPILLLEVTMRLKLLQLTLQEVLLLLTTYRSCPIKQRVSLESRV